MRTKYFKITKPSEYWFEALYYKVAETKEGCSELSFHGQSIDFTLDTGDTFDERVEFVHDRVLDNEKAEEVSREEFDLFYKRLVEQLNILSSL